MKNNKIPDIQFIKKKPYFLHSIITTLDKINDIRKRYPTVRYYYTKVYDTKRNINAYAIYLDRKIIW